MVVSRPPNCLARRRTNCTPLPSQRCRETRLYPCRQRAGEKAGWDRGLLALELQGLIDIGFDVELTGFESREIDLLLDEALEAGGLYQQRR